MATLGMRTNKAVGTLQKEGFVQQSVEFAGMSQNQGSSDSE